MRASFDESAFLKIVKTTITERQQEFQPYFKEFLTNYQTTGIERVVQKYDTGGVISLVVSVR